MSAPMLPLPMRARSSEVTFDQGMGWTLASAEPKQGAVGRLRWFVGSCWPTTLVRWELHTDEIVSRNSGLCASQLLTPRSRRATLSRTRFLAPVRAEKILMREYAL